MQLLHIEVEKRLVVQGTLLTVPPLNYLFVHTREANAYCLGMFNNGESGTLLGGITFRDFLVQVCCV